jgi:hypothetical protein
VDEDDLVALAVAEEVVRLGSGMQIAISTSRCTGARAADDGSPIGSSRIVFVSRCTCVSGTHSSSTIGVKSPDVLDPARARRW